MPGVPSNKACERCKKRHLKCDETRPNCQRCANAGVECPGYVQTRKFIDQGASVRKRYAPYQESVPRSVGKQLGNATGSRLASPASNAEQSAATNVNASHGSSHPAVQSPVESLMGATHTFKVPSPPNDAKASSPEPMHIEPMHRMHNQAAQRPAERPAVDSTAFDRTRSISSRSIRSSPVTPMTAAEGLGFSAGAYGDLRHKPFSPHGQTSSGSPSQRSEKEEFQDIFSELMTGTEHEVAFLTRHFSEIVGPWLDLSDSKKFFAAYVPIRGIGDDYLKYSIAAIAAKHLGRMKGAKLSAVSAMFTSPSTMESYPNSTQVDWFLKAANYYYLAASSMGSAISDAYATMSSSDILASPVGIVKQWLNRHLKNPGSINRTDDSISAFWRKTENLLAASAILTMYKLLDEPGESWQSYLSDIRPVFDALLQLHDTLSDSPAFSQGATAVFWNFARLDYLASYYNRSPTFLDHENLSLWRAADIPIDDQGELAEPSPSGTTLSQEDLAANSLIWLLNKVVNFLSESKQAQWGQMTIQFSPDPSTPSSSSTSPRSYPTTASWLKLCFEFQTWFERLPETFRPCLRIEHPKDISKLPEITHMPFPEIFYCLTLCASTAQQFHFGRLALALNRPADNVSGPSTVFDRLQSYRELMKEADYRCREICGIALGRPQSAARIYMIPLLYAVGQCTENAEERQIIVDLLRGIEADLGWATGSQVQKLQSFWGSR